MVTRKQAVALISTAAQSRIKPMIGGPRAKFGWKSRLGRESTSTRVPKTLASGYPSLS
jgi:hypothetical protein